MFLYGFAAVSGLSLAWLLLGWEGIHGTSQYWETTHNDTLQGIAALRYYLAEPWSWSIFHVGSYGVPEGTSLILTDSIPIAAVPAKALRVLLPEGFHYFGYWMAFCFVMQAVAMVMLFVELRWRTMLATITGSFLALLQTAFLARFFHVALMAQFLIVLVIVFGIRLLRDRSRDRTLLWLTMVVGAAFFVHLYLFAMAVTLAAAFVIQAAVAHRTSWAVSLLWMSAVGAGTAALVAITGLLGVAEATAGGLGHYSLNLLAPLAGNIDATDGQYEGYSYVGVGVLGVGVAALILARNQVVEIGRRCWVPLVAVALMVVFALSPEIWIGESLRLEVPWFGMEWLGDRFRSTGRFVWPLVYVAIPVAIVALLRRFSSRAVAAVLLGALAVQVADMAPLVADVRGILQRGEEVHLATEEWREVVAVHQLVRIAPQHCVVNLGTTSLASREIQRITARLAVPVTEASLPRQQGGCDDPVFASPLAPGELRVVWSAVQPDYELDDAYCVAFDLGTACTAAEDGREAAALRKMALRSAG